MMKHTKKIHMDSQGLLKDETGMIIVMAVLLLTVVLLFAVTATITATSEARFSGRSYQETQAFFLADGLTEFGASTLYNLLQTNSSPSVATLNLITPPSPPAGYTLNQFIIQKIGTFYPATITEGDYMGLSAHIQKYEVVCEVSRGNCHARISRGLEHQAIPLFQFGMFYENDLELFPDGNMLFHGRVHSNANVYIGATNQLKLNSSLTAVGRICHWRKDGTLPTPSGAVMIMDYWGTHQNMNRGGYWLDSSRPSWQTEATSLWGGTVRDSSMGVHHLQFVLPEGYTNQIDVIQRGLFTDPPELRNARYYWRASIRVLDGVAYDTMGNVINMGVGTLGTGSFYDQREQRTMHTLEFDIAAMNANGTAPPNSIIYISGSNMGDAVRIKNGTRLPDQGLTIASDNPVYVWGDYNITQKRSAAIICDAFTVLSANWLDSKSTLFYTNRVACETDVRCAVMTGNRETILNGGYSGNYNGGGEGIIRLLEKWTNVWLRYRGSLCVLWYSAQATGAWQSGVYYSPPKRDWSIDTEFLNPNFWPPGSPMLNTVQRGTWKQIG